MAVSGWWNESYSIRRPITLENTLGLPVSDGTYFFVVLDVADLVAKNKLRADYQDLEVALYDSEASTPGWVYVEHDFFVNSDGTLSIAFVAPKDFQSTDEYYLYYCNRTLQNVPVNNSLGTFFDDSGILSDYERTATKNDGSIMLTRPTEDWKDGTSTVVNARAAFPFYGTYAKLKFTTSSSGGIVEVLTDTSAIPVLIDTHGSGSVYEYKVEYDTLDRHIIRMRATGNKNPSSSDWVITLPDIAYPFLVKVTIGSNEEIYPGLISFRTTVGS